MFSSGNAKGLLDPISSLSACCIVLKSSPRRASTERDCEQSARLKWEGQSSLVGNWTLGSEMLYILYTKCTHLADLVRDTLVDLVDVCASRSPAVATGL